MVQKKKQLANLFDATQCISCGACILACSQTNFPEMHNQSIPGRNWPASNIRIFRSEERRPVNLLVQCQQCENAPCVKTCPFGANYYDENGLVRNDPDKCVGCNYCIASCPYDARWSHPIAGLPMKCISPGCMEMINEGKQPACVQACPAEARLFGDILDPQSEISKKIASSRTELLMPNKGTKPNFFVVVSK